jgi:single-stranded-DNA-specific exonuclease
MHMTRHWHIKKVDIRAAEKLARSLEMPPVLAEMLVRRGFEDPDNAHSFLYPSLGDLPNPSLLPDMDPAVDRLIRALNQKELITIYGDYDADGLTAAVLLVDFLTALGARVRPYIPHRLDEGYGLNPSAVEHLAREGTGLIVTVDCGVADSEAIRKAGELGVDVIVSDHHQMPPELPPSLAVINPHRADSRFPQRGLSGVGVAFFLAGGLRQALRRRVGLSRSAQPELAPLLGLTAIGTVADVMPLTRVNRILVSMGLARMAVPDRPGLIALKEAAAIPDRQAPTARDVAFRLAPRLNAPGRLGSVDPSLNLLLTRDINQARQEASVLEALNQERRRRQALIFQQAADFIENNPPLGSAIVLAREGWNRGVVGLAASKLAEVYHRPAILLCVEDGLALGSARSIPGFNLFAALDQCRDLMVRFGGHEQAAGLTVSLDRLDDLTLTFENITALEVDASDSPDTLELEAVVNLAQLEELTTILPRLAPFGQGNPEPVFGLSGLKVLSAGTVGKTHLRLNLTDGSRNFSTIGFNLSDRLPELGRHVSLALQRHTSTFRGQTTEGWKIVDMKKGGLE